MRLRSPFTSPNWIELKELNCILFGFSRRDSGDVNALIIQQRSGRIGLYHVLLTLPTYCAEQGIYNGRVSVRMPVCLSHRSTAATAAGEFAAERLAGRRCQSIAAGALRMPCCRRRRSAANTGSVMLRSDGGDSIQQTCCVIILTAS